MTTAAMNPATKSATIPGIIDPKGQLATHRHSLRRRSPAPAPAAAPAHPNSRAYRAHRAAIYKAAGDLLGIDLAPYLRRPA